MRRTILLFVSLVTFTLPSAHAAAWDFVYGYQTVFDTNADNYIVGTQKIRKYSEWQDPPVTYWGPSANDVPASLTSCFTFAAPTWKVHLRAALSAYNYPWRGDYGFSSLWGSTNGSFWQLLLDNPIPASSGEPASSAQVYDQDLPTTLLESRSLWLQVRLQEHNALPDAGDPRASWADAQFSRLEPPGSGNVFQVNVMLRPLASIRASEVEICWMSVSNVIYQIECRSSLTTNLWLPVFTNLIGNGEEMCVSDKLPRQSPQRFYRVTYPTP